MCEINLHDQGFITCSNDSSRWGLLDWKTQGGGRGQGIGHKGVISILKQHSYIPWTPKITNFKIPNENSIYFLGHYDFYCHTLVFLILIYMFPTIGLWWIIIKRVWKIAMFWWESIQRNKTTLTESLLTWSKIPFMLFIFQIFCENTDAKKWLIRNYSIPLFWHRDTNYA